MFWRMNLVNQTPSARDLFPSNHFRFLPVKPPSPPSHRLPALYASSFWCEDIDIVMSCRPSARLIDENVMIKKKKKQSKKFHPAWREKSGSLNAFSPSPRPPCLMCPPSLVIAGIFTLGNPFRFIPINLSDRTIPDVKQCKLLWIVDIDIFAPSTPPVVLSYILSTEMINFNSDLFSSKLLDD